MAGAASAGKLLALEVVDLQSLQIPRGKTTARRRRSSWPLRLLLLAATAVAGWLFWPQLQQLIDAVRLPQVEVVQLRMQDAAVAAAVAGTAANGHVVAARRAALSSDVPGRIVELNVTEGTVVQRGFAVARLYAEEFEAALQRAKADAEVARAGVVRAEANLAAARVGARQAQDGRDQVTAQLAEAEAQRRFAAGEFARAQDLERSGSGAARELDRARSELDVAAARLQSLTAQQSGADNAIAAAAARIDVASAELLQSRAQVGVAEAVQAEAQAALDKTWVRAPFDGVVVLKDAEVGEVVSPNVQGGSTARGAVCTMVDLDSLEIQATVPETSLAAVHLGGSADVFLDARPEHGYRGRVDRIWPTADRQKATVEVRIKLLDQDQELRPEMGVRVVFRPIAADEADAAAPTPRLLVPESALVEVDGKLGAFVLQRDRVHFTAAQIGERRQGRAVVDGGLQSGMRVVLDPPPSLRDGDRVRLARDQENP